MMFYERRNGGGGSFEKPVITANFKDTKVDIGFSASHIKIEVIGVGTCEVGFGSDTVHAQLSDVDNGPSNPAIFNFTAFSKLYLRGTSGDVKITAWNDGR